MLKHLLAGAIASAGGPQRLKNDVNNAILSIKLLKYQQLSIIEIFNNKFFINLFIIRVCSKYFLK